MGICGVEPPAGIAGGAGTTMVAVGGVVSIVKDLESSTVESSFANAFAECVPSVEVSTEAALVPPSTLTLYPDGFDEAVTVPVKNPPVLGPVSFTFTLPGWGGCD